MDKQIILNWLPPGKAYLPSPAMTVLKGSLEKAGYSCKIIYWNIILDDLMSKYLFNIDTDSVNEVDLLSIFYAYLSIIKKDNRTLMKQEILLNAIKPQYSSVNFNITNHIQNCVNELQKKIETILKENDVENCLFFGMPMHLFQWIPASVIGTILKSISPKTFIAIGGIGNPDLAYAFLDNFQFYNAAIWGEGEVSIVKLARNLQFDNDLYEIPHIYYRNTSGKIIRGKGTLEKYPSLEECFSSNYSDFFHYYKGERDKISLPIEKSRGCHWNKCKFCFLNQGYRYRIKNYINLSKEIKELIEKYKIYSFSFLDNDVIGKDLNKFDLLLDELIKIKEQYPKFEIQLAEIISRNISKKYIKKMHLAGFVHVQIGYESPSDNILMKIDKKNTFASNLLFIKWAFEYHIHVGGMNILRGLLDETEEDIVESIENIYYQRFFKSSNNFAHQISSLAINKSSRYYKDLAEHDKCSNKYGDPIKDLLPPDFVKQQYDYTIFQFVRRYQNPLWNHFEQCDKYFEQNDFKYELCKTDVNKIEYREFLNNQEINLIEFDINDIHWKILCECNEKVTSIYELMDIFSKERMYINIIIKDLHNAGLLYYSKFHEECVSIINTDKFN